MRTKEKIVLRRFCLIAACLCLLIGAVLPVSFVAAAKDYLPPVNEMTTNYYTSYGEPDIYASVIGDTELERGETANIEVVLSNRGVLYGVKGDTSTGTSEAAHSLALQELEYEKMRTTAIGVKTSLVSDTEYIDIDPETSSQSLPDPLSPGVLPDDPLIFTVTVSNNAPAGVYTLEMPVTYEYQYDARMTAGETVAIGLPELDHASYYRSVNKTLSIPVIVEPDADFAVTDVSGQLVPGEDNVINITYSNTGELPAKDAVARVIVMKPLQADSPIQRLGTIMPGESKTASFVLSSEGQAVEKTYGIDSEIKYLDEDEEIAYSDNMKVNIELESSGRELNISLLALLGILAISAVIIIKSFKNQKSKKSQKNEENQSDLGE
ncbi:hypothetical protein V7O62_06190 [Methanolobus sp. ZRKC2]|uniref:COG1361 S-layer family protein n=1 Tax=Methanolobus sp. ZRKC2 TaxID=3125783 RepID=UPI003249355A